MAADLAAQLEAGREVAKMVSAASVAIGRLAVEGEGVEAGGVFISG